MAGLQIHVDGIRIRPCGNADIPSPVSSPDSTRVDRDLGETFPHPCTETTARSRLQHCSRFSPLTHFATADDSGVIGGIGLIPGEDVHRIEAERRCTLFSASFRSAGNTHQITSAILSNKGGLR